MESFAALKYDVVVVGYGPTGLVLASLLGQKGHQVAVVERWPSLYGKPRLTHIDGETARLISLACGNADHALRDAWTTPHYYWCNGKGQLLMDVAQGNTKKMIWDDHISVHQPHIEEAIHELVLTLPNVHLYRGVEAFELTQDEHEVILGCRVVQQSEKFKAGEVFRLSGKYLVGCDGSKSFVRESIGVDRHDFGFNERWLCVDTEPMNALPSKFDECAVQVCDPKRGYMFMPIGKKRQRFEFALLPNESTQSMQTSDAAYRMLEEYHGINSADVELIRHLVYTFECRLAEKWRVGRVFLAGDAAHTNPPYLGQGACSGMRDGSNLAWKMDLVLKGVVSEELLDSYEVERRPHAKKIMLDSRALGLVANTSNPIKAAVRDLMFRFNLIPKSNFPTIKDGVLAKSNGVKVQPKSGVLISQGHICVEGVSKKYDEIVGFRFCLIAKSGVLDELSPHLRKIIREYDVKVLLLDAGVDLDGKYVDELDALDADLMIVRPDFVLYGYTIKGLINEFVQGFVDDLCGVARISEVID